MNIFITGDLQPTNRAVNININACPNACAHHTFGEIGLLGVKDGGHDKKAYHLFIGSERPDEEVRKPLFAKIPEDGVAPVVRCLVAAYTRDAFPNETFAEFSTRLGDDELKQIAEEEEV